MSDVSPDAPDADTAASRSFGRRLAIWGGSVLGGLVVLVLIAALVLPTLFTTEQLKGYVVPPLETATGRTVEIDDIGLQVLWTPAVRVSGFRLANDERFGSQPAVAARTLSVDVALWPLVTGRIEPTAVGLDGLRVRYTVDEDGGTNFDTLGGPADTTAADADGPPLGGIPLSDVRVTDAQLHYDDRSTGQAARLGFDAQMSAGPDGDAIASTGTVDLRTVRALLPDVRADTLAVQDASLTYDVRAALAEGRVDIRALDLTTAPLSLTAAGALTDLNTRPAVDLSVETGDTDLAEIAGFVPAAAVEGLNPRGALSLNATIAGPLPDSTGATDSLRVDGSGRLTGFGADYQGTALVRDLTADLALSLDSAAVRNVEGTLLDASLAGHAAVQNLRDTPALDLRLTTGALDLATLAAFAPEGEADAYNPRGTLRLDVAAAGPLGDEDPLGALTYDGTGQLAGLGLDYEGAALLRDLGADLSFSDPAVTVASIDGQLFEEPLSGEVTIREPMGDAQVKGRLAGGADLGRLASMADDTSDVEGRATYDVGFSGPLADPNGIRPTGTVDLADVRYPYESFRAPIEIPEATVELTGTGLSMDRFPLRTGEQTMQLEATARNLFPMSEGLAETDPALSATFALTADRLDFVELYPEAEATDVFYSQLFAASLSGSRVEGQDPEAVAEALYGGTEIPPYAVDGRVEIGTFLNDPQRIDDLAFDVTMDDRRLQLQNLAGTTYEGTLAGSVTLDQRESASSARHSGGNSVLMASRKPTVVPPAPATALDYDVTLEGARAGAFLEDWTTIGRIVDGTLDLTVDGDTPLSEGFLPQLDAFSATGTSVVADGGLVAEAALAKALTNALGLDLSSLTDFRRFGGPFSIEDGQIEMETWSIGGAQFSGEMGGQLGLGGSVDLALTLNLPLSRLQNSKIPALAGGGDEGALAGLVKKLAGAEAGSETVPVEVGIGDTIREPSVSVGNRDAIQERLRALAKEEGLGRLRNLLPGGN